MTDREPTINPDEKPKQRMEPRTPDRSLFWVSAGPLGLLLRCVVPDPDSEEESTLAWEQSFLSLEDAVAFLRSEGFREEEIQNLLDRMEQ